MEHNDEMDLFGICYGPNDGYPDYVYIKANPKGLRRFAGDLMEAASRLETSDRVPLTGKDTKYDWHQSEQTLFYVERVNSIKDYYENHDHEAYSTSTLSSFLGKIALIILLIIFCVVFVVGLKTVYNWF